MYMYKKKYLKYKKKYLDLKLKGGSDKKTIEEYFDEGAIEKYDEEKHCHTIGLGEMSLKATMNPSKICLTNHYNEEYIIGVFKHTKEFKRKGDGTPKMKITSRGDTVILQHVTKSCSISSLYMIALSKNIEITEAFNDQCNRQGLMTEHEILFDFAKLLGKTLIYEDLSSIKDPVKKLDAIKNFITKYGVSAISSHGHIKVIDDFIKSSKNPNKEYAIIRDQYGYQQFIYEINTDKNQHPILGNMFPFIEEIYTIA